ncbi:MAG: hypothetical protein ACR2LR_15455 [Hassallia sp.]
MGYARFLVYFLVIGENINHQSPKNSIILPNSRTKTMHEIKQAIEKLKQAAEAIRESGAIAPEGVTIDTHHPGGESNQVYKRLRSRKAIFTGKRGKTKTRTFNGSDDRKDWESRIIRRNQLKEVQRVAHALQEISDDPIWTWLHS